MKMPKFDDFDLDIKTTTAGSGDVEPRITSVKYCTPGTCFSTCKGESTLISNCCLGSALCSLSEGCRG